jgi:hypothetical protein
MEARMGRDAVAARCVARQPGPVRGDAQNKTQRQQSNRPVKNLSNHVQIENEIVLQRLSEKFRMRNFRRVLRVRSERGRSKKQGPQLVPEWLGHQTRPISAMEQVCAPATMM